MFYFIFLVLSAISGIIFYCGYKMIRWPGKKLAIGIILLILVIGLGKNRHALIELMGEVEKKFDGWRFLRSSCPVTWDVVTLRKDDYYKKHLPAAQRLGKDVIAENKDRLIVLLNQGKLVRVKKMEGFFIASMNNGEAMLTPLAFKRLKELGYRFSQKLIGTKEENAFFMISSMYRSVLQQKRIKETYPKAAAKGLSAHNYGVSFDIHAIFKVHTCEIGSRALESVLLDMQKEGKFLLVPEKNCIHVTVIK